MTLLLHTHTHPPTTTTTNYYIIFLREHTYIFLEEQKQTDKTDYVLGASLIGNGTQGNFSPFCNVFGMYLQEECVCVLHKHRKLISKSSLFLEKIFKHSHSLLCCIDRDGDGATMVWVTLSVIRGSLNSVYSECFRGADTKAQIFRKPTIRKWNMQN